jgi:anti-sigma regulatory factor (Ser/Thr protein kinase)
VNAGTEAIAHGEHVVHFYEHEARLVASVCPYLEARAGVSAAFPADADSPRHARRMAVATLRRWGHDEALIADISLVVSELASNAVRHAGSAFSVALQMEGSLLRVTVEDRAPLPDTASDADMLPQPPHGLCVVDSLATSWGVEPTRAGKIVWAQLTCAAPLEP